MSRETLRRLGAKAALCKKLPRVAVTVPKQIDAAFIWKPASIHPMQVLQNLHHRTVREAIRLVSGDDERRDAASDQLGAFCYFDSAAPQLLPPPDSLGGDDCFLDERLADVRKQATKLVRVVKGLKPRDLGRVGAEVVVKLSRQLQKLRAILDGVPDEPGAVTGLRDELDAVLDGLRQAPTLDGLADAAWSFDDLAARLERLLQSLCCIANFHVIDTFYLWRLLVKYRFTSDDEITSQMKSDLSGEVTSLLHNGAAGASAWLTDWLTRKLVALNAELMALDEDNLFFYLKGGRALQYMMGTPQLGENDFDTGIIINPELPPAAWYELFREVHNLCLRFLRRCKYEFIGLVERNQAGFDSYVEGIDTKAPAAPPEEGVGREDDAKRLADLMTQLQPPKERTNGKAELIDIGMPRRDTPEVWETWHLKESALTSQTDGMVYPGPLYYIGEYMMMIRDAFQPGSRSAKKSGKRLVRLGALLATNITDAVVTGEYKQVPKTLRSAVKWTAEFGDSAKAVKVFLKQMSDAHRLEEDQGLTGALAPWIAEMCRNKAEVVQYSPDFQEVLQANQGNATVRPLADACGFAQAIAAGVERHLHDRGEYFRRNYERLIGLVRAIYSSSIFANPREELDLLFAVTGAFAARLHADYADYEHLEDIEPLHRIDLTIFCKASADPAIVHEIITPGLIEVFQARPEYLVTENLDTHDVLVYSPVSEAMGEFTYPPLILRLTVERRPHDWPSLAFIWGLPVLGLRELVWDYIRASGHTEEFSARQRLRKTTEALTDILSELESAAGVGPAAAPNAPDVPDDQPPRPLPPAVLHNVPDFQRVAQEKPNWCWAAVSAMMRAYYGGENISQAQIVRDLFRNDDDQQGPLVLRGLTFNNAGQGRVLSWDDLKRELDDDRPFIIASGQHYMVAVGYKERGPLRKVYAWDPLPTGAGRVRKLRYEEYCAMVRRGGATYSGFSGPARS